MMAALPLNNELIDVARCKNEKGKTRVTTT